MRCKTPTKQYLQRMCWTLKKLRKNWAFFHIYPFYHEKDHYLRDYKEKRFIIKWKPPLNINRTWLFYCFIFNDYLSDNKNNFIFLQFNFKRFVKHCWLEKSFSKLAVNILILFLCSPLYMYIIYIYIYTQKTLYSTHPPPCRLLNMAISVRTTSFN